MEKLLEYILRKYGINLIESNLQDEYEENICGLIAISNEDVTIAANQNDRYNRKRFTVVHELGHLCVHSQIVLKQGGYVEFSKNLYGLFDKPEIEANTFGR